MTTLTPSETAALLSGTPMFLGMLTNQKLQDVMFYCGEENEGFVFVAIYNGLHYVWANTEFFETDDMLESHGEYTPILTEENEIVCAFEYYSEVPELIYKIVKPSNF